MSGAAIGDIPFLDEATVERHLDHDALIEAMARAFVDFSAGRVVQPVRQLIPVEPHGGFFGIMPAIGEAMGIKLLTDTLMEGSGQKPKRLSRTVATRLRMDTPEARARWRWEPFRDRRATRRPSRPSCHVSRAD